MAIDWCLLRADFGALEEAAHAPRAGRNRTSADRCDDGQGGVAVSSSSEFKPKQLACPDPTERPSITAAMLQHQVNTSAVLILELAKKRKNVTVIVHCRVQTTSGKFLVFWTRRHQRYEDNDGPMRIRAVEAMDDLHQDQGAFLLMWPEVMSKHPRTQERAMELNSYIVKETSKAEGKRAKAERRAPMWSADASEAGNKQRSTTDNLFLCEDAADQDGVVVKLKACMDNGRPGSICINTRNVGMDLPSHSVLRAFYVGEELVEMPA